MNTTYKSSHAMLLPAEASDGTVPRWIHILPAGTFRGKDGRGPYRLKDAAAVIRASLAQATEKGLPMDYDHQIEHTSKNGAPAPASGWITDLEARDNGIWAAVDWTEKARAHVASKEYRYVSPVYYHNKGGDILSIESVALTNKPNFRLKALASAGGTFNHEEHRMYKALASMLDLHEEASESAIESAVRRLQEENKALAAKADTPDPARFVPMSMFTDVQKELACMKELHAQTRAENLVDGALAEGKLTPAMREWAKEYASMNPEGFKAWATLAPDVRPGAGTSKENAAKSTPPDNTGSLTDTEKSIAAACGMAEDDYQKEKGV